MCAGSIWARTSGFRDPSNAGAVMALKSTLRPRQTQRLALTPALVQSMSLLRMPATELREEVQQQLDKNPFLQVIQAPTGSVPFDDVAPWIASTRGLSDLLSEQLALMDLPPRIAALARFLIGDLDENGYLQTDTDALSQQLSLSDGELDQAVAALQSCDPPGVGARNLAECLHLQLCARGIPEPEAKIICAHLDLFAQQNLTALRRETGWPRARLSEIAAMLMDLSPHPAAAYGEPVQTLIPDVIVERDADGGFTLRNNTAFIPDIRLDQAMLKQLDADDPIRQTYLEGAEALLRGLRYRGDTIHRIATAVVQHQHAYFSDGPDRILPLTRADIADKLDLHPSTVGRAIAGKVLSYDGVSIPFNQLLSSALTGQDGAAVAGRAAQHRIARIVADESRANPLSDEQIAELLRAEGVDISRRTVAKYRGCLNIPSSFKRRRSQASP